MAPPVALQSMFGVDARFFLQEFREARMRPVDLVAACVQGAPLAGVPLVERGALACLRFATARPASGAPHIPGRLLVEMLLQCALEGVAAQVYGHDLALAIEEKRRRRSGDAETARDRTALVEKHRPRDRARADEVLQGRAIAVEADADDFEAHAMKP